MTSVCRICLAATAGNRSLSSLNDNLLHLYEKLSNNKFNCEDARPRAVCCYCYQKLLRCYTFSHMAHRSEMIFSQLLSEGIQATNEYLTEHNLGMKQHLSVSTTTQLMVSTEPQVTIKEEPISVKEEKATEEDQLVQAECPEDCTHIQSTTQDSDQGNDVERLSPNTRIEQTKPDVPEITFICNNCNQVFFHKTTLISHIRKSHLHLNNPYSCTVSDKKHINSDVVRHVISQKYTRTHTGEKPFACNLCDKQLKNKKNLAIHMKTHTGERRVTCHVCHKHLSTRGSLISHLRTHTGEKPYACNICDKRFNQNSSLHRHKLIHTGEKPFACHVCNKKFNQNKILAYHIKSIHTGEKQFACNVCNKQFIGKGNLVVHMRIHTGEKRFDCNHCNKKFRDHSGLRYHMSKHTGKKPFACDTCGEKFVLKSILINHLKKHTGEKPFACNFCSKKFILNRILINHLKTHTGKKQFPAIPVLKKSPLKVF